MDYGKNKEDPIKSLRFYSKHDQVNADTLKETMVGSPVWGFCFLCSKNVCLIWHVFFWGGIYM